MFGLHRKSVNEPDGNGRAGDVVSKSIQSARSEYDEAMKLLSNLCKIRYPSDYEKKYESISRSFEEMVQGVLLITAIQDLSLCVEEWKFLESFTSHVSILKHLNEEMLKIKGKKHEITLQKLQHIDDETRDELNGLVRNILETAAAEFYRPFAEVDYIISEVDYLREFKLHIVRIVRCICIVDGDDAGNERAIAEKSAGLRAFFDIIEKYWKSFGEQDRAWRYALNSSHDRNFIDRAAAREEARMLNEN